MPPVPARTLRLRSLFFRKSVHPDPRLRPLPAVINHEEKILFSVFPKVQIVSVGYTEFPQCKNYNNKDRLKPIRY